MTAQAQYIERIKSLEQANQALLESNDYYKNRIDQLNQMIHDLKRHRFGKRSEVYHHPDQKQFDFLQDVEPAKVIDRVCRYLVIDFNHPWLKSTR